MTIERRDELILDSLKTIEGGYSNYSADRGGETYMGVSRIRNPRLLLWHRVDEMKQKLGIVGKTLDKYLLWGRLTDELKKDEFLTEQIVGWYTMNYWIPVIPEDEEDEAVAQKAFSIAVNQGVEQGIRAYEEGKKVAARVFKKLFGRNRYE